MAKKILNIFISQPMHGRSEEEIVKERKEIMQLLGECNPYKKTWDLHIIDNLHHENVKTWDYFPPERAGRLWNLGQSISKIADADLIVFVCGWDKAAGCNVEWIVSNSYEIPYIFSISDDFEFVKQTIRRAMQEKNKWRYKNGKEKKNN